MVDLPLDEWMGHLPTEFLRSHSFTELAIPAAHNAAVREVHCVPSDIIRRHVGSFLAVQCFGKFLKPIAGSVAICQEKSIPELLKFGIRSVDLRVGEHSGGIYICHAVVSTVTLETALLQVAEFLKERTSEVVHISVKRDYDHPAFDNTENWKIVLDIVESSIGDLAVSNEDMLNIPLAELCGGARRALVMVELPEEIEVRTGIRMTAQNLKKSWRDAVRSVGPMVEVLNEWRNTGQMEPERGCLKFLEVALPFNPKSKAPKALAAFRRFMQEGPLHIGAMLDFPDEETIRAIIRNNFETVS